MAITTENKELPPRLPLDPCMIVPCPKNEINLSNFDMCERCKAELLKAFINAQRAHLNENTH